MLEDLKKPDVAVVVDCQVHIELIRAAVQVVQTPLTKDSACSFTVYKAACEFLTKCFRDEFGGILAARTFKAVEVK